MMTKEVKTEKREQKTESEKLKRWSRTHPKGISLRRSYALNAPGNFDP